MAKIYVVSLTLIVLCSACGLIPGGGAVPDPVVIVGSGNVVGQRTREQKIQERLDSISLSAEKNAAGIYHIFTVSWTSLADVLESGDKLSLERVAPDQTKAYALLTNAAINYRDQNISDTLGQIFAYRLRVELSAGSEMLSANAALGSVTQDPFSYKPAAPLVIMQNNQKTMLQAYLNGFKVLWIDDSENDTKFEITKCVLSAYYVYDQDLGQSYAYEQCVDFGNVTTITIDTASDSAFRGQREYFDSEGLIPSSNYDDLSASFVSGGYCYKIRALNPAGASVWTETECRRLD